MNDVREHFNRRLTRFGRVRRRLVNAVLTYGVGGTALGVGIAALVLLSGWIAYTPVNAALALAAFCAFAWLLARLLRRWERRRGILSEAFRAEALAGDLNSRLISAVDFLDWPEPTPLTEEVVRRARQDLERPFERLLDRARRNLLRTRFALLLVLFLLLGSTEWFGFARLGRTVALAAVNLREVLFPTRFELFPGTGRNIHLIGSKVETGIRFTRFRYPEVTMLRETAGQEGVERTVLPVDAAGKAALTLQPTLDREYRVRFSFGRRITEEMKLVFTSPPVIENMQTELVYPLYTRLVPKETEGIQDRITALPGTRVSLGLSFSKALNWAVLTFDDGERMPLDVVGRFASVSFVHSQERRAVLQVEDIHGFRLGAPHSMDFGLTADNPPRLIVVPRDLKQNMPYSLERFAGFTFGTRVEDDFGAAKCVVQWRKSTTDDPSRVTVQGDPIERAFLPPRPIAVAAFENIFREQAQTTTPGDLFLFQVEAFDNRDPKPQSAVSALFSIFIRGQELEDGVAGGVLDIMKKFVSGVGGTPRPYRTPEGSRAIKMPAALITAEKYVPDFKSDRNTDTRGAVRGPLDQAAAEYGKALSGANP